MSCADLFTYKGLQVFPKGPDSHHNPLNLSRLVFFFTLARLNHLWWFELWNNGCFALFNLQLEQFCFHTTLYCARAKWIKSQCTFFMKEITLTWFAPCWHNLHNLQSYTIPDCSPKFGQDGRTPLLMAIQGAYEDVVKLLLERGAKVNIADNAKK